MGERFGNLNDQQERHLVDLLFDYIGNGADDRAKAAERRHNELLARVDTLLAALSAGMRAAAQVLDSGRRR